MKRSFFLLLIVFCGFLCLPLRGQAQEMPPQGLYLIFDGSGSMWGQLPDKVHKVVAAKEVLQDFIAGDFAGYELALRVYGHRRKSDCTDSELVVPFGPPEQVVDQVAAFMKDLNPLGKTPITYSLRKALEDFGDRPGEIILISDGVETCNEDPCALVHAWRERNVAVRVHVVGFGLEEKEKAVLQCISEAAGTTYRDAGSAATLAEGLQQIRQEAASDPIERTTTAGFYLRGTDAEGQEVHVEGTLKQDGLGLFDVASHQRHQVTAGTYELVAGIPTANGTLYQPVTKTVAVTETGDTRAEVVVPIPPRVHALFKDSKAPQRGSLVHAFQGDEEQFRFRWIDTVYVEPGTYAFRAKPNAVNDLEVTETIAVGEHKTVVFEMARTVRVTLKMLASGSEAWYRQNYELWQEGEKKFDVHMINGAQVPPGTYDLHLPDELTPYVHTGLVINNQDNQHYDITIPSGHVMVYYLKADGTRDTEARIWLIRLDTGEAERTSINSTGKPIPLTPGRYRLRGWSRKGNYDEPVFEIKEGDEKVVVLRDKG